MNTLSSIGNIINQVWSYYIDRVGFITKTSGTRSLIISILILIRLISFIIILPIHRISLKQTIKTRFSLTKSVDKIIYLLSKAQYTLSEQQPLQYDPCFALMKSMFDSGHFEYVDNIQTIKDNVHKVELLLHQSVISEKEWENVDHEGSKLKRHQGIGKILGCELSIVTLGIYKLFW